MTPQFLSSATPLPFPPRICLSRHPPAVLNLIARPAAWFGFDFRQRQSVPLPPKITQPLVPGSTVITLPPHSIFKTSPNYLVGLVWSGLVLRRTFSGPVC